MSGRELPPVRCCLRIVVRMERTWIGGEAVAAGVGRATGAAAAIGWPDRRNSGWRPLGFVAECSENDDCMICSELHAQLTVVAAAVFADGSVVVVAVVFVADPSVVRSDAGCVSVPLERPGEQQPWPFDDRARPYRVHLAAECAGVRGGGRHPSVFRWMYRAVRKVSVHDWLPVRRM